MHKLILMAALTCLFATVGWADEPVAADGKPSDEVPQEETAPEGEPTPQTVEKDGKRVFTDRMVVTASRREQAMTDTPAAISVITAEEIENKQPAKMADLFKELPGLDVAGEGPFRGLPVLRGLSSNRVLILVDGQRLNNARESTLFAGVQPGLVEMGEVEQVEVLRGPASVMYGSDAVGGVVNIITKKPNLGAEEFTLHGNVRYEYGSAADSNIANASINGTGKGYGFNLNLGYETSSDYKAPKEAYEVPYYQEYLLPDGTVPNSGMDQASVQGGFRVLTGAHSVLKASVEIVHTTDIGFPGFDPETSGVDISFPLFDRNKLGLGWDSGPMWGFDNISVNGYYQHVVKENKRFIDPSPYFFIHTFIESDIKSYGFNAQGLTTLGRHQLTIGLDSYRDNLEDKAQNDYPWESNTDVSVPKSHQTGVGLYVQDEFRATDRLRLLGGVRWDSFAFKSEEDPNYQGDPFDVTDSDFTGNLGAMYALTKEVELTALVGRGFRQPNIQERAFTGSVSEPGYWVVQNPDLTAEQSMNYEVGFKVHYDRYFGSASIYYNDLTDFITFVDIGEDPITGFNLIQYDNIEDATIKGVELSLDTIISNHWTLLANYSYTEGTNDSSDEPLEFIPPWKVVLGLRYQQPKWWTELTGRFVGEQTKLPSNPENIADEEEAPVGDFITADLRAGYDFDSGLSLRGTLANLFDEVYSEPYNLRPEAGRNIRFSIGYSF